MTEEHPGYEVGHEKTRSACQWRFSLLGRLLCWIKGRHRWQWPKNGDSKRCSRCGLKQAIRRRLRQDDGAAA